MLTLVCNPLGCFSFFPVYLQLRMHPLLKQYLSKLDLLTTHVYLLSNGIYLDAQTSWEYECGAITPAVQEQLVHVVIIMSDEHVKSWL